MRKVYPALLKLIWSSTLPCSQLISACSIAGGPQNCAKMFARYQASDIHNSYWKIESLELNHETFCVHTTLNLGLQDPNWFWLLLCNEHQESAKRIKIQRSHPGKRFSREGNSSHFRRHQQRSEDHSWSSLQPSLLWHAGNWIWFFFRISWTPWRLSHDEKEKFEDPTRPRTLHWNIWD